MNWQRILVGVRLHLKQRFISPQNADLSPNTDKSIQKTYTDQIFIEPEEGSSIAHWRK